MDGILGDDSHLDLMSAVALGQRLQHLDCNFDRRLFQYLVLETFSRTSRIFRLYLGINESPLIQQCAIVVTWYVLWQLQAHSRKRWTPEWADKLNETSEDMLSELTQIVDCCSEVIGEEVELGGGSPGEHEELLYMVALKAEMAGILSHQRLTAESLASAYSQIVMGSERPDPVMTDDESFPYCPLCEAEGRPIVEGRGSWGPIFGPIKDVVVDSLEMIKKLRLRAVVISPDRLMGCSDRLVVEFTVGNAIESLFQQWHPLPQLRPKLATCQLFSEERLDLLTYLAYDLWRDYMNSVLDGRYMKLGWWKLGPQPSKPDIYDGVNLAVDVLAELGKEQYRYSLMLDDIDLDQIGRAIEFNADPSRPSTPPYWLQAASVIVESTSVSSP